MKSKEKVILIIALVSVNFVYFISSSYVHCSNDGSHFALLKAIVDNHSVKIDDYVYYTGYIDYNIKDGHYYSDRSPGTAYLAIPFYLFGKFVQDYDVRFAIAHWSTVPEVFVVFLPNITGTLSVLLIFLLFMHFKFNFKVSLISSIIFAFATPIWGESTHLFSHSISTCAVLAAVYFLLMIKKFDLANHKYIVASTFFLSLASIVEIQNIMFFGAFACYLLISKKISFKDVINTSKMKLLFFPIIIFLIIYSTLIIYNYEAFGELTIKSNKYNPKFLLENKFSSALSGNFLEGLDKLFTNLHNPDAIIHWDAGVRNDTPGFFVLCPILLISLLGYFKLFKHWRDEAVLFALLIILEIVVVALHPGTLLRHAVTITPYLIFPIAFMIGFSFEKINNNRLFFKKYSFLIGILLIAAYSAIRVFYVMASHFHRSIQNPFPFIHELKSYFFFYACLAIIIFALGVTIHYLFNKFRNCHFKTIFP